MDYDKFDYPQLVGYPNAFVQRDKHATMSHPVTWELNTYLKPLVDALSRLRPSWKFVATRAGSNVSGVSTTDVRQCRTMIVYDGNNENLGIIDAGHTYRNGDSLLVYLYDTKRLNAKRQRGSWTQTSKLDVAIKGITKNFTPKNPTELLNEKISTLTNVLGGIRSRTGRAFNNDFQAIQSALPNFVMKHWGTISQMLRDDGIPVSEELPTLYAHMQSGVKAYEAAGNWRGALIYMRGSDYVVARKSSAMERDTTVTIIGRDELPDNYKRNLGLLKLSEVGVAIDDVGIRADADTYFVIDKEPAE